MKMKAEEVSAGSKVKVDNKLKCASTRPLVIDQTSKLLVNYQITQKSCG